MTPPTAEGGSKITLTAAVMNHNWSLTVDQRWTSTKITLLQHALAMVISSRLYVINNTLGSINRITD